MYHIKTLPGYDHISIRVINMNLFIYCFSVLLLIYCQTASIFVVKGGLISESFSTWLVTQENVQDHYPRLFNL